MIYNYNLDDSSIVDRILSINNATAEQIDVSNFHIDENIQIVEDFKKAILTNKDKRFLIVGDYDCDGICATSMIKKLLDDLNIQNNYYIPSRSKEGYGLNDKIVSTAIENGFGVILTVDNGVTANSFLTRSRDNNIITLIIDHHEYDQIPKCDCLLHPSLFSEKYADMCASGIACLLSMSFRYDELTLALGGLATLADMVRVFNYNRYLLVKMLQILSKGNIHSINYLLGSNHLTYEALSYHVIPKINAVSRLDEMMNVNMMVKYLLGDENYCLNYIVAINKLNDVRKDITKTMSNIVTNKMDVSKDIVLVYDEKFKEGICGLVANKIMYEIGKPVIILSYKGNELVGSGRSPRGFNIYDLLLDFKDEFKTFGGHANAVGLSIDVDKLEMFKDYLSNQSINLKEETKNVIKVELDDLNMQTMKAIESLEPFGAGFEKPLFVLDDVSYKKKIVVAGKYPKYILNDTLQAISFNSKYLDTKFSKLFGFLSRDTYNLNKLTFNIEDFG